MVRKKDELYFPVCAECLYVVTSVSIIKIVVVDIQLSLIKDFEFVLLNLVSPMWISNIEWEMKKEKERRTFALSQQKNK